MSLLADVYSYGDGLKRKMRGLLADSGGAFEQMAGRLGDDQRGLLNLQANAYPMRGDRTVLNTPQQIAQPIKPATFWEDQIRAMNDKSKYYAAGGMATAYQIDERTE